MWLTPDDLTAFVDIDPERAGQMITDVEALARAKVSGLDEALLSPAAAEAVRAVLRRVILRWYESGVSGSTTQLSAGPFSQSTQVGGSRGLFLPSELDDLRDICSPDSRKPGGAFTVRPSYAAAGGGHQPWCHLAWGSPCSCGADLTRGEYPLYEGGKLS